MRITSKRTGKLAVRAALIAALGAAQVLAASVTPMPAYAQTAALTPAQRQAIWTEVQAAVQAANAQQYPVSAQKQSEALAAVTARLVTTYGPLAPAAVSLAVRAAIAAGVAPETAIASILSAAILAGAPAGDTTSAVMTAAGEAGVTETVLGEALGDAASTVEASNADAAAVIGQTVASLGGVVLAQAFADSVADSGGTSLLGSTGSGGPAAVSGGGLTNPGGAGGGAPCANPSCS